MKSRAVIVSSAWALSTFVLAAQAQAQTPPPGWYPPPPYLAHVSVQAGPSAELSVLPAGGSDAVARCTGYCDFWTLPGRYTLYSLDHSTGEREHLALRITQSSRFQLEPGDSSARTTGLVVGIGGSAAVVTGLILITSALLTSGCDGTSCGSDTDQAVARVGLGFLLAGAIATPIGWTVFAHNRPRLQRIDEGATATTDGRGQVNLGVVGVGRGGWGLGAVGAF